MEKKLSIYKVLVPLFAVFSCLITSVWFIKYDMTHNLFFLSLGLTTFVDYLLSLVSIKVYWIFVDEENGDNCERLLIFLIMTILGLIPFANWLVLILFLCIFIYNAIKYFLKKNDIKLEL